MTAQEASHDSLIARLGAVCQGHGVNYVTRQPIGDTPFNQPFKADLILDDLPGHGDLVVIARQQDRGGSTEQKLPFLVMAINRARRPCLVVLDGPGWSEGAITWMHARKDDRIVDVVDLEGFEAFLVAALGRGAR